MIQSASVCHHRRVWVGKSSMHYAVTTGSQEVIFLLSALVPIHPFRVCTGEYFYSPLHKRWGTFVVLEQPPFCSDLTCHPGHHTDQIATHSNIVFYFSCLLLSVVTSKTKAAKNICWALEATSVNPLQLQRKTTDICNICL